MPIAILPHIENNIARCRLILSLVAIVASYVDPTHFTFLGFGTASGRRFSLDPYVAYLLGAHLAYSLGVCFILRRRVETPPLLREWTTWGDVVFAAAIALFTEAATSPFYPFFVFAVVVVGFRSGLHQALLVTAVSITLYLGLVMISTPGFENVFIMRPAYLGITGYLVGYLGQQRMNLHEEVRQLEAVEQRHRIARDLHDGFAQAFAGINLRIAGACELLHRNQNAQALAELADLRVAVNREYDDLRTYMRSLAGIEPTPDEGAHDSKTVFSVAVNLQGTADLVEHVLQIVREGVTNVRRHARATAAEIAVLVQEQEAVITVSDDGIGIPSDVQPWSITSRAKEIGGVVQVLRRSEPGTHLVITIPCV